TGILRWSTRRLVTLAGCLDLEQVYDDQDEEFYIKKNVKRGVVRRFVRDIPLWVQKCISGEV
ncbi:hypothetical protein BX600DRAFT_470165, partial [Xylariales sp. PMI_506]